MTLKTTSRGFAYGEFTDYYSELCTIQKSSIATKDLIWLGRDGYRMHLTRDMVAELLPLLTRFVETGRLEEDTD
jgi:hypothetical protein